MVKLSPTHTHTYTQTHHAGYIPQTRIKFTFICMNFTVLYRSPDNHWNTCVHMHMHMHSQPLTSTKMKHGMMEQLRRVLLDAILSPVRRLLVSGCTAAHSAKMGTSSVRVHYLIITHMHRCHFYLLHYESMSLLSEYLVKQSIDESRFDIDRSPTA